jgi:hypothetical protein
MLAISALEKVGWDAPVKAFIESPRMEPFELMMLARTDAAPDCCEVELPESTLRSDV